MSILPQLERDLREAARRRAAEPTTRARGAETTARRRSASRRRPASPLRVALIAAIAVLAGATIALAATGVILTGTTVRPSGPVSPTAGLGVPAPGGARLLSLRVADPGGGLPWGVRVVHT